MNTRRRTKWVLGIGLLCWSMAACGGSKDITFVGEGATGGSGGTGTGTGGTGTGGAGTGGSETGGTGGSGGSGGSGTGGEAGGGAGGPPVVGTPGQGMALAPGGNVMKSENYTLILTTGESPEGNTVMSSDNYLLKTGLVGVTERE